MLNLLKDFSMKKSFFLAAAAALAMTSCSNDEMTDINNGNAIGFRAATQTRATETTTANLENFFVTAFKGTTEYFSDEFTKDGSYFTSETAHYWPGDNSELSFFAYSPEKEKLNGLSITNSGITLSNFSPASEISDQVDFITATATGKKSENEATGVELTFNHMLSQIEVRAKNMNEGYVCKVVGVRIGKPVSKGSFINEWQFGTSPEKSNYEATCTEATLNGEAVSLMGEGGNAMLIPQQLTAWNSENDKQNDAEGAYLAVKIQIETPNGVRLYPAKGDYDWAAVGIDTKWEAGKKYIYTLDFSKGAGNVDPEKPKPTDPNDPFNPGDPILGDPIKFTVIVTPWTPVDNEDIELE